MALKQRKATALAPHGKAGNENTISGEHNLNKDRS